ncbi:alpha/beta fold hydrolase [Nonomuraea sp. NPDC049709]|uniref:alpha/beta fold hydrolase n=1 Tax=Nonomuraea sp. NPDC049709 TaxID=3154736 RepID=UPI003415222D
MPPQGITLADHVIPLAARDHGGAGSAVLLLHGLGGALEARDTLAPLLARRHQVVTVDLCGHGLSRTAPGGWDEVLGDIEVADRDPAGMDGRELMAVSRRGVGATSPS